MKTPRFWQHKNAISSLLLPAALLYRMGAWVDRTFTTPKRAPLPVISVGNITAGGAGKTPTTLALVPILRALGHTPHILTRGYGGAPLSTHRVSETDDWQQVGDEALLLARAAPTWVGRDRLASAIAAQQAGATILLCDDALQHHALHKDMSLLVIDGPYGLGNGLALPAGPLREDLASAVKRCDAVILIGADAQALAARITVPLFTATLEPAAHALDVTSQPWLAFAGIGRPEKFFDSLRARGAKLVATRSFADHHAYTAHDLKQLEDEATQMGAQLITTTKDAVKLPAAHRSRIAVLPVVLGFSAPDKLSEFIARTLTKSPAP